MSRATEILNRVEHNGDAAAQELLPLVYDELRRIAVHYMARQNGHHTLQPTALIHEAYFKLIAGEASFRSHAHFVGVAANAMRQVLVDHARRRKADKRGGDWMRVTLDQAHSQTIVSSDELLALEDALTALSEQNDRLGRVVELRFFGELTIRETAAVLGVSHTTVEDDWAFAKAWLARELANGT